MRINEKIVLSIIVIAVVGGATTTTVIKSSAHKLDSAKSSNIQEKTINDKKENKKEEKSKEEKKVITKEEAGKIAEDMLEYMHFYIENKMYTDYEMSYNDELWAFLFDCSYAADVKEIATDEPPYLYKIVTEEFLIDMARVYGYTEDELPKVPNDYKDMFEYDKESKTYKVNTYSDAGLAFYDLVKVTVEDNNDIKVIIGYTDEYEGCDTYSSVFEVILRDLYPKEKEFNYYLYSLDEKFEKYDVVEKEEEEDDKEDIEDDEDMYENSYEDDEDEDSNEKDEECSNSLSSNKELETELAKMSQIFESTNDDDYFTSKYSDKEKTESMCNMIGDYIFKDDEIELKGIGGERYADIDKDFLEAIVSVYDSDFKKLPSEKDLAAKYDSKKESYRFSFWGNASFSIGDKINEYTIKEDGTIEVIVGSYMMYSIDKETEKLVDEIEDLQFVKRGSKFDRLKIGEKLFILKENDFKNKYFKFTIRDMEYLETEFDDNQY